MASFNSSRAAVFDREERRQHYASHVLGLNAYERHKKFMTDYVRFYAEGKESGSREWPIKTDLDTLRETYRFIRSEDDDSEGNWEQRLAKRYYDKLFREYCIADMSRYRESKIGLRWRGEKEVIAGKGQFICGNRKCNEKKDLHSYEVNFAYKEAGEHKQALVKLRLCSKCAYRLNYRKEKEGRRKSKVETAKRLKGLEENPKLESKLSPSVDGCSGSEEETDKELGKSQDEAPPLRCKKGVKSEGGEFDQYFDGMFV